MLWYLRYLYVRVCAHTCARVCACNCALRYVTLRPALPVISESLCTDHIHMQWSRFEPVSTCRILSIFWKSLLPQSLVHVMETLGFSETLITLPNCAT